MRVGELVRGWTRSVVSGTAGCGESGLSLGRSMWAGLRRSNETVRSWPLMRRT